MPRLINCIPRALLALRIYLAETYLATLYEANALSIKERAVLTARRDAASLKLCRLRWQWRERYTAPGEVRTWRIA
jgi:hypothetical protein